MCRWELRGVYCAQVRTYVRYVQHVPMNLSTPVSLSRCRVFFFASAALIISESTGACGWRNYVTDTSTRRLEGHGNVIISLGIKGWNLVREKTSHRSRKRLIRLFQLTVESETPGEGCSFRQLLN